MGRTSTGKALSNTQRQRKFQDKAYSIDNDFAAAYNNINWQRRNKAEQGGLVEWVKTYCIGLTLEDLPPSLGEQVLAYMEMALRSHDNFGIELCRGGGKTAYTISSLLWALSTGVQKFIVLVTANARASNGILADIFRAFQISDSPYAQDYPECVLPFTLARGCFKRIQTLNNQPLDIKKTSDTLQLPTYNLAKLQKVSGSLVVCRSITGAIRGLRKGILRPTCCLIDDIQTTENASNQEQVQKLYDTIRKDIIPMAGKERLSILQTFTPIVEDDLVAKIKNDKSWKVKSFPAIIHYPNNKEMWKEYFKLFDGERVSEMSHDESLKFYAANQKEMDEGSEVFNPSRYSKKDGHLSAIQKLLQIEHDIGEAAFMSEYQMEPVKSNFVVDINPTMIVRAQNHHAKLEIPTDYRYITFGIDINPSYAISVVGIAWKVDTTGIVFFHHKYRLHIDQKLPDSAYNKRVYDELEKVCDRLVNLGVVPNGVAIDCGGRQWDAVNLFAKNYKRLPICAFAGRSSTQFAAFKYSRTRLKDAIGNTVLCGDASERTKSGSGFKYCYFDADWTKHCVHQAFACVAGDIGSLSLYAANEDEHTDFAIEICNEKLKQLITKSDGRVEYVWATQEPHDLLDCCSMCRACLSQLGVTATTFDAISLRNGHKRNDKLQKLIALKKLHSKVRIV